MNIKNVVNVIKIKNNILKELESLKKINSQEVIKVWELEDLIYVLKNINLTGTSNYEAENEGNNYLSYENNETSKDPKDPNDVMKKYLYIHTKTILFLMDILRGYKYSFQIQNNLTVMDIVLKISEKKRWIADELISSIKDILKEGGDERVNSKPNRIVRWFISLGFLKRRNKIIYTTYLFRKFVSLISELNFEEELMWECKKCHSKNVRYVRSTREIICSDCGYTFTEITLKGFI